jgi:hypothetical protein
MKKLIIGIVFALFVGSAIAEDILDVSGNQHDRIWVEMKDNWHKLATGGTLTNGLTVTGTLTATAVSAPVSGAVNATTLKVSGVQTNSSTLTVIGAASFNNISITTNIAYAASSGNVTHNGSVIVNTNLTVAGTILATGVVTHVAIANFRTPVAVGSTNVAVTTLLPDGYATAPSAWLQVSLGGTNGIIPWYKTP